MNHQLPLLPEILDHLCLVAPDAALSNPEAVSSLRQWLVRVCDNHGASEDGGLSSRLKRTIAESVRFANEDLIKVVDEASTAVFDDSAKNFLAALNKYLELGGAKDKVTRPLSEAVRAILADGDKVFPIWSPAGVVLHAWGSCH